MPNTYIDRDTFLENLYEAAILPELWPNVLMQLSEFIEAEFASLLTYDGYVARWTGTDAAVKLIEEFKSYEQEIPNTRIARAIRKNWLGFVTDDDIFDRDEMDADPFYTRFMRPRGYGWTAGTIFQLPTDDMLVISIERNFARGPVERKFIDFLDSLRPHLGRSALMSARLRLERALAITQAFEALGMPAAALTATGRFLQGNRLFSKFIPSAFRDERTRLRMQNIKSDKLLDNFFRRLHPASSAISIPIPGGPERPPAVVHLIPVCGRARDIFSGVGVIVLVASVKKRPAISASVLELLFDLTPAEAVLAHEVAQANDLASISEKYNLSLLTVRSRLKAVFAKTGTRRQAELAHFLGGSLVNTVAD